MQYAVWCRTGSHSFPGPSLHEHATGIVPDLSDLHEWGCRVWVRIEGRRKLEPQADEGRFVGYSTVSKGALVYWPGKRSITVEHNIAWDDSTPVSATEVSQ
ncbi:hypothetical protein DENSPDRAFT_784522 [Dentipellis sp. KUC8613]|nr:hypothetical protein DENSPDRAFT_784522 [Dentipellis sp. KUC8613]